MEKNWQPYVRGRQTAKGQC